MDEADARHARERSRRAQAILQDGLVVEALAAIERRAHSAWAHSRPDDAEGREAAYRDLRALQAFKAEFEAMIRDGQVADFDLAEIDKVRAKRA